MLSALIRKRQTKGYLHVMIPWNEIYRHTAGIALASTSSEHEEDSPPGGPPDPESDTNDIVISLFINKIINLTSPLAPPLGAYCPQTFMTPTSTVVYVGLGA
ncbi:hypothetical protein EMCRGX_G012374 [Ephydatia muelleri]